MCNFDPRSYLQTRPGKLSSRIQQSTADVDDTQGQKKSRQRRKQSNLARSLQASTTPLLIYHLAKLRWCYALYSQQIQALLTLFTKNFSTFPHGTCLLSVSNACLAFDEVYHPLCDPFSKNVTLEHCTELTGHQLSNRTFTYHSTSFQKACSRTSDGHRPEDYKS